MALVSVMASGCVTRDSAKLQPAIASAPGAAAGDTRRTESAGSVSSARGDNWTAANQFEEARAGYDSPLNRFNLAAAYESTGRSLEAAALYRTVLIDGRSTSIVVDRLNADTGAANAQVNLAEEAKRRLAVIEARKGELAKPEFAVGASASPFVGGPASGPVTDAHARRLDEAARTANEE
ncbi:MAG TPA: hypothetical protein VIO94_04090 [Phenylobacterium sp.]